MNAATVLVKKELWEKSAPDLSSALRFSSDPVLLLNMLIITSGVNDVEVVQHSAGVTTFERYIDQGKETVIELRLPDTISGPMLERLRFVYSLVLSAETELDDCLLLPADMKERRVRHVAETHNITTDNFRSIIHRWFNVDLFIREKVVGVAHHADSFV